jgi:transcriptional regulator with XRE-family HTH domain
MVAASSPTVWRRWLALELRRFREESGLAQRDVGRECGWSGARVSYLENAQQALVEDDLDKLLPLYEVPEDDRARYYEAVQRARGKGWWERFDHLVPDWLSLYIGLEQGAASIRQYSPLVVPGLLQTASYTAAIVRGDVRRRTTREVERLAELRTERHGVLTRSEAPVELSAVLDESVLHRSPGDDEVFVNQLEHLIEAASWPNVTVQILPLSRGAQAYAPGAFSILGFPWDKPDSGIVYVEYRGGALYLDEFEDIESHILAFEGLADLALSPEESLATMRDTKERHPHP